ncbi:hypothetical protein BMS3Abin01_00411 [bacterium BMS3Abin01]|nr:hypothetical protein BMS3Abin01_00411 [bacterium BMS3Abin01]
MTVVLDKAQELADAISSCEELSQLKEAAQQVEGDETATSMIGRLQEKQEVIRRAASTGLELPEEQIGELKELQAQIGDIPAVQEFNQAQGKFNQLMEQVNNIIAHALSDGEPGDDPEVANGGHSCGCGG